MSGKKKDFMIRPFEKLRKRLEHKPAATSKSLPARRQEDLTEEELFNSAMGDVQKIEMFRAFSCEQHRKPASVHIVRRDPDRQVRLVLSEITEGTRPINLPDTQEYVEWTNPEYGSELCERLHEGRFSVQSSLDLHGHTVPEAEEETDFFLRDALAKGVRCVKIIYGRGLRSMKGPRIKNAVIRRLAGRYRNNIIAYVSARQCDGGLGAVYILLKP